MRPVRATALICKYVKIEKWNVVALLFCGIFQMKNADNEPLKTGHASHQLLFRSEIRQK
jgi:hypothetical protein